MFSDSKCVGLLQNWDKGDALKSLAVFGTRGHFDSRRVFWNRSSREFKQPHFSESIPSELFNLERRLLFPKRSKFCRDYKNAIKIPKNVFLFSDDGVLTCWRNFPQLWREYVSSPANVLPNTITILYPTKRDVSWIKVCWLLQNWDKGDPLPSSAVFGTRRHFDSRKVFWNRSFRAFK